MNPSADRNKDPILSELLKIIPIKCDERKMLEISSGTGQHVAHFAPHFPNLKLQPSEIDPESFPSINAYIAECPTRNICNPLEIDITTEYTTWKRNTHGPFFSGDSHQSWDAMSGKIDYMLNINMIHITPFECTIGLFQNASGLLKPGGQLLTYGPYGENGVLTPQSNVNFDRSLKQMNPSYGVRDLVELRRLSEKNGIEFIRAVDMPANNKFVIWQKACDEFKF